MVNLEGPFEAEALRVLRDTPGVQVKRIERRPDDRPRGDFVLRFAGTKVRVVVETKRYANAATAHQLVAEARALGDEHLLLIAGETTAETREILEQNGIALIDGLGNAHLELPGLLLHVEGRRALRRAQAQTSPRLAGKAGVAAQALLLDSARDWRVKELAERADVSSGLAHRVFVRLENEGVIGAHGSGPHRTRRVTNATALLDLWAEEDQPRPHRTRAYLLVPSPRQLTKHLGNHLAMAKIEHAVTGAGAAALVAPLVTAVPVVEVWASAHVSREALFKASLANPVDDGENVVFLQAKDDTPLVFHKKVEDIEVANVFRLYADLRRDPRRGQEQAENLRKEVIGF